MKIKLWLFNACFFSAVTLLLTTRAQEEEINNLSTLFSFSATTTWKDFTHKFCPKRWVWTGMITLKSMEPVNLQELCLQWHGEKIANLQASLYQKKETDQKLIPIQDNLVCDGQWNTEEQRLTFFLDKKIVAVNKYYLFLNFPEQDSAKIKHGTFDIQDKDSLKLTYFR